MNTYKENCKWREANKAAVDDMRAAAYCNGRFYPKKGVRPAQKPEKS